MTVSAVRHLQRMRGGAQSHMMLCDDDNVYVVKFQNNSQDIKVLANELLATRLAQIVGFSVPACEIVEVSEWLIAGTPALAIDLARGPEPCRAGLQFGSRLVGGLMPGLRLDRLDDDALLRVENIEEFAGMLVFDKWTGNIDGRQVVFSRKPGRTCFKATFIDQGYCFGGEKWQFSDYDIPTFRGVYGRQLVYREVTGLESFRPWLERVESFDPRQVLTVAATIPPEWYNHDRAALEHLLQLLIRRRETVRELIFGLAAFVPKRFPKWPDPLTGFG